MESKYTINNIWSGETDFCNEFAPVCKYKCCRFTSNYIALYPGELEGTKKKTNHLEVIVNDYFGGGKARCIRPCNPVFDYKPLDCKSYPLFPQIASGSISGFIRGKKCPVDDKSITNHALRTMKAWGVLIENDSRIAEWLANIRLIGYKHYSLHYEGSQLRFNSKNGLFQID